MAPPADLAARFARDDFFFGERFAFLEIFLLADFFLVAISVAPRFRVPGIRACAGFPLGTQ